MVPLCLLHLKHSQHGQTFKMCFPVSDQAVNAESDTATSQPQLQLPVSQQPNQSLVISQAQLPGGFENSSQQPQPMPHQTLLQGQSAEFRQPLPPPRPRFPPNSVVIRGPNSVHVPLQPGDPRLAVSHSLTLSLNMLLHLPRISDHVNFSHGFIATILQFILNLWSSGPFRTMFDDPALNHSASVCV